MINSVKEIELIRWIPKNYQVGQRWGRYTAISFHRHHENSKAFVKCQCDCGSPPRFVRIDMLRNGKSFSCGCFHREKVTTHGAWGHPLFAIQRGMIRRCYNPKDQRYKEYGNRGITVCERWHDVNNFIADMSEGYQKGLQIDRIDNDKGYSPDNCRWVDRKTQCRNTRRNVYLTHDGKTLTLIEWSNITGISYGTLWDRIKQGWEDERVLTSPVLSDADIRCAHSRSFRHNVTI